MKIECLKLLSDIEEKAQDFTKSLQYFLELARIDQSNFVRIWPERIKRGQCGKEWKANVVPAIQKLFNEIITRKNIAEMEALLDVCRQV